MENKMTSAHVAHLELIKAKVEGDLDKRYRAGNAEHGGALWKKPVLGEAIAEATDLIVYLHTLRQQIEIVGALASIGAEDESVAACESREACKRILGVLHGEEKAGK